MTLPIYGTGNILMRRSSSHVGGVNLSLAYRNTTGYLPTDMTVATLPIHPGVCVTETVALSPVSRVRLRECREITVLRGRRDVIWDNKRCECGILSKNSIIDLTECDFCFLN